MKPTTEYVFTLQRLDEKQHRKTEMYELKIYSGVMCHDNEE